MGHTRRQTRRIRCTGRIGDQWRLVRQTLGSSFDVIPTVDLRYATGMMTWAIAPCHDTDIISRHPTEESCPSSHPNSVPKPIESLSITALILSDGVSAPIPLSSRPAA